ncbi:MAG: putative selenate reductase subunit YgfK, partial [Oscillospiraceae bacterium]
MSDRMTPIPFGKMMDWVLCEYAKSKTVFGVSKLYKADVNAPKLSLFGENIELPFGPAAGPHTQLAQNIIAAYSAGSRFFELKTVQTLDGEDLPVAKPCINAADECYNVEWSTELWVPDAYNEYVKAWFALKLISRELSLGAEDGFIFNMSVG